MAISTQSDPVPAITEKDASGATADIFADIRGTLNVEVVNLIWRHLATMPGALEWVWGSLKPLYQGPALQRAEQVRRDLRLPGAVAFSRDTLSVAGIDDPALASIGAILDSYQHTNALALVCFSAFLSRFESGAIAQDGIKPEAANAAVHAAAARVTLPRLVPVAEMPPSLARLVQELNEFGEDSDPALVASMYRHLSHWPSYLALVRTLLAPLQEQGALISLLAETRKFGAEIGAELVPYMAAPTPGPETGPALAAIKRFVDHPIARMTGVCALIRRATPV